MCPIYTAFYTIMSGERLSERSCQKRIFCNKTLNMFLQFKENVNKQNKTFSTFADWNVQRRSYSGHIRPFIIHKDCECKILFGRPFVKRLALCYQTVVCLSVCFVCPVCDVRALWPNGWTDKDETWHSGRFRDWPHCLGWGPSSSPLK